MCKLTRKVIFEKYNEKTLLNNLKLFFFQKRDYYTSSVIRDREISGTLDFAFLEQMYEIHFLSLAIKSFWFTKPIKKEILNIKKELNKTFLNFNSTKK